MPCRSVPAPCLPKTVHSAELDAWRARRSYIAGRMGRALAHPDDPPAPALARDPDDGACTLDHIALERARLEAFRAQFADE